MSERPSQSVVPEGRADVERRIAATLSRLGIDVTAAMEESPRELELLVLVRDLRSHVFRLDERLRLERLDAEGSRARAHDLEAEVRRVTHHSNALRDRAMELEVALRCERDAAQAAYASMQARLEERITDLASTQTRLQERITDLASMQARLQERIVALRREADALRGHAATVEAMLRDVLASTSWRAMRPLRKLLEGLRGRRWREPSVPVNPHAMAGTDAPGDGAPEHTDRV